MSTAIPTPLDIERPLSKNPATQARVSTEVVIKILADSIAADADDLDLDAIAILAALVKAQAAHTGAIASHIRANIERNNAR